MNDIHTWVAPYALDALDALDRRRFEAHLAECEACRSQQPGFAAAAASLGASQAMTPPAHLRAQILSAASTVSQDRTFARAPRSTWRRILPALAVAAALVVPAAGAAEYVTTQDNGSNDRAASAAVSSVLAAPDAATRSRAIVGGGTVRVVTSHLRSAAIVAADDMPSLAPGKTYQVWTLAPSGATSRGTFASSTVVTAKRLGSADRVAVTVEPDGGSARPTSLPVAVLAL